MVITWLYSLGVFTIFTMYGENSENKVQALCTKKKALLAEYFLLALYSLCSSIDIFGLKYTKVSAKKLIFDLCAILANRNSTKLPKTQISTFGGQFSQFR